MHLKLWRLSILLAMSRNRPGFAQNFGSVVTLPPPTSIDPSSTATSSAQTTATVLPSILYPVGNPILNNIDTLIVQYTSSWDSVNLVVTCGETVEDDDTFTFRAENLPPNGPYDLTPIQQSLDPSSYPIFCQISIEDTANAEDSVESGDFIMTSTGGSPSRYAQTTTAAVAIASLSTAITTTESTASSRPSNSHNNDNDNVATTTTSDRGTAATVAPASATSESSVSSGGLSSGGKAGVALAVIIFLALLALLIFFLLRYRRKLRRTESELHQTQAEAAAAAAKHADEKAYVDSILQAAGKPEMAKGGRIVVADLGSRQSGDWRQFFASKANSARQAISSAGSRGNSRSGSRRASRPPSRRTTSNGDIEAVPTVPRLPSPTSLMGETASIKGDGSTVGLVSGETTAPKHNIKRKPLKTPGQ